MMQVRSFIGDGEPLGRQRTVAELCWLLWPAMPGSAPAQCAISKVYHGSTS